MSKRTTSTNVIKVNRTLSRNMIFSTRLDGPYRVELCTKVKRDSKIKYTDTENQAQLIEQINVHIFHKKGIATKFSYNVDDAYSSLATLE